MATIKSFTDISQSKKLAEILPHESADMHYWKRTWRENDYAISVGHSKEWQEGFESKGVEYIPCWSLAALLGVLPFHLIVNNQRYAFSMHKGLNKNGETYMFRYNVFNTDVCLYETDYYNNPVDACYEMILKLHELKML